MPSKTLAPAGTRSPAAAGRRRPGGSEGQAAHGGGARPNPSTHSLTTLALDDDLSGIVRMRHALPRPHLPGREAPVDSVVQAAAASGAMSPARPVASSNRTGLPDRLKAGIETLSGDSLDAVRVHANSPQPARLGALAYTQGSDIHVGPGQERHLAHEAWHAVQQMQGRVQATVQMRGVGINDDGGHRAGRSDSHLALDVRNDGDEV